MLSNLNERFEEMRYIADIIPANRRWYKHIINDTYQRKHSLWALADEN